MLARMMAYLENINNVVMQGETQLVPILSKQIKILHSVVDLQTQLRERMELLMSGMDDLRREVGELKDSNTKLRSSFNRLAQKIRDLIANNPNNEELAGLASVLDQEETANDQAISNAADVDPGEPTPTGEEPA